MRFEMQGGIGFEGLKDLGFLDVGILKNGFRV